jgi:hypothetical protein
VGSGQRLLLASCLAVASAGGVYVCDCKQHRGVVNDRARTRGAVARVCLGARARVCLDGLIGASGLSAVSKHALGGGDTEEPFVMCVSMVETSLG